VNFICVDNGKVINLNAIASVDYGEENGELVLVVRYLAPAPAGDAGEGGLAYETFKGEAAQRSADFFEKQAVVIPSEAMTT
jgi:hypothetical protein